MCTFSCSLSCRQGSDAVAGQLGHQTGDQHALKVAWKGVIFVDNLTGLPLPPDLCREARKKELEYFKPNGIWKIRSAIEARSRMGRSPISVRRVETSNGDDIHPHLRSSLVALEISLRGRKPYSPPLLRWNPS